MYQKRKINHHGAKQAFERNVRISLLMFFSIASCAAIILRLFWLQVVNYDYYYARAQDQYTIFDELVPKRGEILVEDPDGGLYPLATSQKVHLVYADPRKIENPRVTAEKLAPLLEMETEEVEKRLDKSSDPYEPIKEKVLDEVWKKIEGLNITGIFSSPSNNRYYPEGELASQVVGFLGRQDNNWLGQYGIEGYYEDVLRGEAGYFERQKDAGGDFIPTADDKIVKAKEGKSLVLTIDRRVQFETEKILKDTVERWQAEGGSAIIIRPQTGEILAMANFPTFDPNKYNEVEDINVFQNAATYEAWEPGSVFKIITMSSAINAGKVTPNTFYDDSGSVEIAGYTIKNFDAQGRGHVNMTKVLVDSLNTGAIFAERQLGHGLFNEYANNFGFGSLLGIDLDSESAGNISSLAKEQDIYSATASFGQGITVTPLQMVMAGSVVANQGTLMKPYIVKKIVNEDGTFTEVEPEEIRDVLTPATAATVGAMMVSVVENGYDHGAGIPGYLVAGKTGTAQLPDPNGDGYDPNQTMHSFLGFAPLSDPVFTAIIKINKPKSGRFAANTISPYFGNLTKFLLQYYQVPPDQPL